MQCLAIASAGIPVRLGVLQANADVLVAQPSSQLFNGSVCKDGSMADMINPLAAAFAKMKFESALFCCLLLLQLLLLCSEMTARKC